MSEFATSDMGVPASPRRPSAFGQFRALLYKNMLLQLRSRSMLCGLRLGGAASVAFEVLLPVLFIGAMCLVTRLPTVHFPATVHREWMLQDSGWASHAHGAPRCFDDSICPCAGFQPSQDT
jgi:hypothetical protein